MVCSGALQCGQYETAELDSQHLTLCCITYAESAPEGDGFEWKSVFLRGQAQLGLASHGFISPPISSLRNLMLYSHVYLRNNHDLGSLDYLTF